jgi:VWFA-related protein
MAARAPEDRRPRAMKTKATPSGLLLAGACCLLQMAALSPAAGRHDGPAAAYPALVQVPVQVLQDGEPVRGLAAADFELREDGARRDVGSFGVVDLERPTQPAAGRAPTRRHYLLLFDLAGSELPAILAARRAVREWLLASLAPGDLAAVATFGGEAGWQLVLAFTSDRREILAAVAHLGLPELLERQQDELRLTVPKLRAGLPGLQAFADPGAAGGEAMAGEPEALLEALRQRSPAGRDQPDPGAMARTLSELAQGLDAVAGRKLAVLFSAASGGLPESLASVIEQLRRADCVVATVDLRDLRELRGLTGPPGGASGLPDLRSDLDRTMALLAKQTSVTYLLGFRPPAAALAGSFHRLEVELNGAPRASRVDHRPGYYAPRPYSQLPPDARRLAAGDQLMSDGDSGAVGTAVLAAPFRGAAGKAYVPVLIEADGGTLLSGSSRAELPAEVYACAVGADGTIADSFGQVLRLDLRKSGTALRRGGLKFFGHLELPAGEYSVRVLVRNGDSGAFGKRSLAVTVPAFTADRPVLLSPFFPEPAGRWAMVREPSRGEQRDVPYPFMVGHRAYVPASLPALAPGKNAAVALVGYNLGDGKLSARAVIQSADGRDVANGQFRLGGRESGGASRPAVLRAVFRPPHLAPGDYRLVVTLSGPAGTQTGISRFAIAAPGAGKS